MELPPHATAVSVSIWAEPSSLCPFPIVSICPLPLFHRVNWEKWVWMALMEKRLVLLAGFVFIMRCSAETSEGRLESSK